MAMRISKAEWAHIRDEFIDRASRLGVRLRLRDRVWAVTQTAEWIALPGTSDSPVADRWWLGCDPAKLLERKPVGIVLLCKSIGGSLHPIGLPRELLLDIEPRLSKNDRHVFFSIVRRGTRFLLQLRGGEEVDVTAHLDDLSWVAKGGEDARGAGCRSTRPGPIAQDVVRETEEAAAPTENRFATAATRFFAVVKDGALHPLDDVTLEPGSLHLVEIREAPSVPGNRSLRRILARGGPPDLPADLAEQHDHYAHGRVRR
jgi:hypothetical protein